MAGYEQRAHRSLFAPACRIPIQIGLTNIAPEYWGHAFVG